MSTERQYPLFYKVKSSWFLKVLRDSTTELNTSTSQHPQTLKHHSAAFIAQNLGIRPKRTRTKHMQVG